MPYRKHKYAKRPRRGYRKRYNKRKAKYNKATKTIVRGPTGFADTTFVKLTYCDNITISPATFKGQYTFRGNSLFDPDYTGTGHQPMYFDQYAAIYNRYRVLGCTIRLDLNNYSQQNSAYAIVVPSTEIITGLSISQMLEQGRAKAPKILPIAARGPQGRIKQYCSTRKACGLTKTEEMDQDYSATTGSHPAEVWYWNTFFETVDASSNLTVNMIVKLTYYCQFYDRLAPTQS